MKTLTTEQINDLERAIYNTLMSADDMGMGEMGDCMTQAEIIVSEWMEKYNITEEVKAI